jgi:serine/threonine protein phosphatase PrpC
VSAGTGTSRHLALHHGAATDPGSVRATNEDACGVDPEIGLFVVADGLGGHRAGEVASAVAVERFRAVVRANAAAGEDRREAVLRDAIAAAHEAVRDAALHDPTRFGMGTTMAVAWVGGSGSMWVANVGDSRCYHLRGDDLAQLSLDHTLLEELRRAGMLPDDPLSWPPRTELTQAVGLAGSVVPHLEERRAEPGDRILLCSDGLTDMLADEEIRAVLVRRVGPERTSEALVQEANLRGGLDNTTVVVVDVEPMDR